jgi:hypothetical protein
MQNGTGTLEVNKYIMSKLNVLADSTKGNVQGGR